ncbi:uncharacterized protein LOC129730023 [Wyeomyia smithii]|uniref:uncharacterized protein LOC129730023 n=1 Tax=Wyeomyia smithii TaxID=174621 RepID=UPI00246822CA|nr:uncharacterized protein LOC129730023 [Wyeomyia smithii]
MSSEEEEFGFETSDFFSEEFMTNSSLAMDACFTAFDKDGDDRLSLAEFTLICRALFRNDKGHIYVVPSDRLEEMFAVFDKNEDGYIDRDEFQFCWNQWIKTIVRPVSAFLIVDVQNDFISGSLNISNCSAQQNGLEVIDPINKLLDTVDFDSVFYSLDWHPSDHVSFIDNIKQRPIHPTSPLNADNAQVYDTVIFAGPPPMKQRLWPRHCVQDSWGSELHKDLKIVDHGIKVYKGTNPEVDSYSVFWDNKKLSDTSLCSQLRMKGASDIYVCGLAYDVCVGATAIDALSAGYRTILIDDCCRGVDVNDIESTKETVISNNGVIINTREVKAMVEGRDRRPELGYKLAMELKNADSDLSKNNACRRQQQQQPQPDRPQ